MGWLSRLQLHLENKTKQRKHGGSLASRILGWDSDREEVLAAFPGVFTTGHVSTERLELTAVGINPARTEGKVAL